jgi:Zn-dependent M28 family amino/carboxypeptidase
MKGKDLSKSKGEFMVLAVMLAALLTNGACRNGAQGELAQATQQPTAYAESFDPGPSTSAALHISGEKAYQNLNDFVALGPRPNESTGHVKAEKFIVEHLAGAQVEQVKFTAQTAAGPESMNDIIGKFPGKKDGVIVLAGHYDTNLPFKDTAFVGANDGGSNVGLMLEIANELRRHPPEGYSIWLVFTDGEEATVDWSANDSVYGSKFLAKKWAGDGTATKVKAFLLLDMIGDKDLDVDRDMNSTPWLLDVVYRAAQRTGQQSHFYARQNYVEDDHLPFLAVGIPVADLIDIDYGPRNSYHHTLQDTPDKCSAASLQIVGDVVMETIRALNTH